MSLTAAPLPPTVAASPPAAGRASASDGFAALLAGAKPAPSGVEGDPASDAKAGPKPPTALLATTLDALTPEEAPPADPPPPPPPLAPAGHTGRPERAAPGKTLPLHRTPMDEPALPDPRQPSADEPTRDPVAVTLDLPVVTPPAPTTAPFQPQSDALPAGAPTAAIEPDTQQTVSPGAATTGTVAATPTSTGLVLPSTEGTSTPQAIEAVRISQAPAALATPPVEAATPIPARDPAPRMGARQPHAQRPGPVTPHQDVPVAAAPEATDRLLRARPNTAFTAEPAPTPLAIEPAAAPARTEATTPTPLDTQHRDWRAQMIDRIETFATADAAPSRETRITLSPDALGEVAVRLVETDRGIEVALDAATPEARALLAEAAPRLADMAEARGLRLSLQTGSGDGGAGDHRPAPPRPQPDTPMPNRRPASTADAATDDRIA
ncbi:flagellar hook-length control protein FliK [Sphingomonas sp. Y38-1Y]|uniref:flagellar hook-length control protein FliK n=1 Tax=Sphingomonas sp. Y38-1Y TaxID=3078265 RepID=UPI0028ECF9A9|nr:flagellar hook-length control protein FliK [Sphingomonas sp. Y38-1Y]